MGNPVIGTCRLCQSDDVELRNSHVVPRWLYKRVRGTAQGHTDPVQVADGRSLHQSRQGAEALLCDPCERHIKAAEDYASKVTCRADDSFPALDMVGEALVPGEILHQPGALRLDFLQHFGLSVIWRASVARGWATRLGPYEEPLRRHVLGAGGPRPTTIVPLIILRRPLVPTQPARSRYFMLPTVERDPTYHIHTFHAMGVTFMVFVGGGAGSAYPPQLADELVIVTDDRVPRGALEREIRRSTAVGGLRKLLEH